MTRVTTRSLDGAELNVNSGVVTNHPGALYSYALVRSDIVKTPEHALWLRFGGQIWLPPTTYGFDFRKYTRAHSYQKSPSSGIERTGVFTDLVGLPQILDPYTVDLESKAIYAIRSAIKENRIQWGAAIGEMQQTIGLIASSANSLAKSAIAAKHGNWRKACSELGIPWTRQIRRRMKYPRNWSKHRGLDPGQRKFANRWLELQFGWKPLLSDIDGACHELADKALATPSRLRFRATAGASNPMPKITNAETIVNSHESISAKQKNTGTSGVRYNIWYQVVNRALVTAAQTGLLDIGATAWELTPWSFVIDWIAPVGPFLESLTALAGKEFVSGTRSTFIRQNSQTVKYVDWSDLGTILSSCSAKLEYRQGLRYVLSDFPATPRPKIRNPLSITHALDAIALLTQSARGFYH